MAKAQVPVFAQLLPDDKSLGHDVAIPDLDPPYLAKTLIGVVKLVNRRGRVRWCQLLPKGSAYQWSKGADDVKGEDDLPTFIEEGLAHSRGVQLVVTFEDRNEAKTFLRDLNDLRNINPSPAEVERHRAETEARQALIARHSPAQYPLTRFTRLSGGALRYTKKEEAEFWTNVVEPRKQDADALDQWTRRYIKERFYCATYRDGSYPIFTRYVGRYWRLKASEWKSLIDQCDEAFLVVRLTNPDDYRTFHYKWGPGQFLIARTT